METPDGAGPGIAQPHELIDGRRMRREQDTQQRHERAARPMAIQEESRDLGFLFFAAKLSDRGKTSDFFCWISFGEERPLSLLRSAQ